MERKTDLIIQITPNIVVDAYTGITKSDEMQEFEDYVIHGTSSDTSDSSAKVKPDLNEEDNESDTSSEES